MVTTTPEQIAVALPSLPMGIRRAIVVWFGAAAAMWMLVAATSWLVASAL
jgi:hypothetical protein